MCGFGKMDPGDLLTHMLQIGIQHDPGLPGCGKWTPVFLPASLWHPVFLMWTVLDPISYRKKRCLAGFDRGRPCPRVSHTHLESKASGKLSDVFLLFGLA